MQQFFDAANWQNIPRDSWAMLYRDGQYSVPPNAASILGLARVRYITVTGWWQACGAIDWEPGNPCFNPAALRAFVRGRRSRNWPARVYVEREYAAEAWNALSGYTSWPGLFWWIPTLDGHEWTAQELADDLRQNWDAPIPVDRIWANQWNQEPVIGPNAVRDVSNLFLNW